MPDLHICVKVGRIYSRLAMGILAYTADPDQSSPRNSLVWLSIGCSDNCFLALRVIGKSGSISSPLFDRPAIHRF